MKRYQITKIVFAENIPQLVHMESGGEITYIELKDDVKSYEDVGFIKSEHGKGKGKRLVQKIR